MDDNIPITMAFGATGLAIGSADEFGSTITPLAADVAGVGARAPEQDG